MIEGIEFRSVTVLAWKGKQGPCLERNQAVIYRGPWKYVVDDDGHRLDRGQRMAVCDKTYRLLQADSYAAEIIPVEPRVPVPLEDAGAFQCAEHAVREPRATKGLDYRETILGDGSCCGPEGCC